MWTIHDLEVLFHHYCSTAPWPRLVQMEKQYRDSIERLWIQGLITRDGKVTPKGCAFVAMLQKTPPPEQGWFDPRVTEDAA